MYQIALAYSKKCEEELKKKGFHKQEVYINYCCDKKEGESDFWGMKFKPFQFLVSSFWGAGPD